MAKIGADQVDLVDGELVAGGPQNRQIGLAGACISEGKLAFSWVQVDIQGDDATWIYDGSTRSSIALSTAASTQANVEENSTLARNGVRLNEKVDTTAALDEWSLSGSTLYVHGDVPTLYPDDEFNLEYVAGSGITPNGGTFVEDENNVLCNQIFS